ncbi:FAD-dependent pyridine nucleotide-disulphide oxidoreductase [Desulfatibacillum aliphaticivorans]|uniref:FAD-dependent pyridine nucleotide-disulphide oxidoreductase n=1 Tax=Desulfatibacillum aliphaticivorans TaxID=218208 RepID=B8F8X6_DESAL|nr:FAD-dependent oxidoreductase [Desulfatibacillum aliphaticivorans]ACL02008.1 FAD-dependent pyridine nucleotide-disulphide oxidoreductase [Desulfatibacillum aliphaticivorans]
MDCNIVIVGGGPAGVITALTAKSVYPEKSVCIIKEIADGVIPCSIPYMIYTLADPAQSILGNKPLEDAGVKIIVDKAESLDTAASVLTLASSRTIDYERLVIATGSSPVVPPIPGVELPGVFSITKSLSAISLLREKARAAKRVVILGGGFIGAEFADELTRNPDAEVHIVEILPRLLSQDFDDEFCDAATAELAGTGVQVHTGRRAISIGGEDKVKRVELDDGTSLQADIVIIGVGGRPNAELAAKAGLTVTEKGSIWVDSYMRTTVKSVFAVGDCALKRDFFTRKEAPVWLASTATSEARIAGTNLYGIRVLRQIQGTVSAFSTKIGGLCLASAGMTRRMCEEEGFRIVTGEAMAPDRHPGFLPGPSPMKVKLIFANRSGALLGGQVSGGPSVGELINVISIGIQMQLNVRQLDMMQIATHPLLTSAPTVHPLINAAHNALAKLRLQK